MELVGLDFLFLGEAGGHFLQVGRREVVQAFGVLVFLELFLHVVGHVQNPVDVGDGQAFAREFLVAGHGPETVGQVIVFHRAVLLDIAVAAMVVGQHQPFGRDDLAGTSASEVYHRVLQADSVGAIHIVYAQVEAHFLHNRGVLLFQIGQHPHAFVGESGEGACGE